MGEVIYVPLSQEIVSKIGQLKSKNEKIEEFIERLVEEQFLMKETNQIQLEKMKELWDNEEDNIWDKLK